MSYKSLEDSTFEGEISKSTKSIVDFYADWCGPCKIFAPIFEKVSNEIKEIDFFKVDVDKAQEAAQAMSIMSIPTTIFLEDGEEKSRVTGTMSEEEFNKKIKEIFS